MRTKKIYIPIFILLLVFPVLCLAQPPEYLNIPKVIVSLAGLVRNIVIAVSVVFVVLAGFYFITAGGEPANIEKGKKILVYVAIGLIVTLGAEGIIRLLLSTTGVSPGEYSFLGGSSIKFETIIDRVVDLITTIVTGLAVIFIVLSGFNFITAQGDEAKINRAKSMLLWALIGLGIAAGAKILKDIIEGLVK